jgi:hypothetical protein
MWRLRWGYVPHRSLIQSSLSPYTSSLATHLPASLRSLIDSFQETQVIVKTYRYIAIGGLKRLTICEYILESHPSAGQLCFVDRRYYYWYYNAYGYPVVDIYTDLDPVVIEREKLTESHEYNTLPLYQPSSASPRLY